MSKLDFIFEMTVYLISNNSPPQSWSLSSSNFTMTMENAVTNDYNMRGSFSRIFFKNEPVQTNSDYKGYTKTWVSSTEK